MANKGKEAKEKEQEKDWGEDELKELFKDFLLDWKTKKEKGSEDEEVKVPVPPADEEKKKEAEEKNEKKNPGILEWLFG